MKRLILGLSVAMASAPTPAAACISPNPGALAWASCALSAMPPWDAAALVKLEARTRSEREFERAAQPRIQKLTSKLARACGTYASIRRAERYRPGWPVNDSGKYFPGSRVEAIYTQLLMRRESVTVGCGG